MLVRFPRWGYFNKCPWHIRECLMKRNVWRMISTLISTPLHGITKTVGDIQDKWAATWQNQQNDCAPSEDSDQPGHPPSLIRVFAVRMKKPWVLSNPLSAQRRLWSDWADAKADPSHRWAHRHFVGFVMSRLICEYVVDIWFWDINLWK